MVGGGREMFCQEWMHHKIVQEVRKQSTGMIPSTLAHYICDSFNGSSAFDLYLNQDYKLAKAKKKNKDLFIISSNLL